MQTAMRLEGLHVTVGLCLSFTEAFSVSRPASQAGASLEEGADFFAACIAIPSEIEP
jgi:hypothetical protein